MNNRTARIYFKSILFTSILMTVFAIFENIFLGHKVEYQPIQGITIMVSFMIPYQCCILFMLEKCELSFMLSILTGFFSGIALTLAARIGLALSFLLLSSDRNMGTVIHIFSGFWHLYLWMALLGIVCMLIEPFFRVVLHRDLFRPSKSSSFIVKYFPSTLFYRYVLRKDPPWQDNTDLPNEDQ